MTSKRKIVFVSKKKRETEEEYQIRISEIIKEESRGNGYALVNMEEKGGGIFLTFEMEVED